jgi:peptidoglycan/LPS O-acetylase OafA/YrhL
MACLLAVKSLVGWMLHQHGIKIPFYFVVPIFITSVIALASLSYWVLERPFLKLKDHFRPTARQNTPLRLLLTRPFQQSLPASLADPAQRSA